jgi:ligand-binding SRPBCC domain-containing protein
MPVIETSVEVHAPIEILFDLSRSVEVHLACAGHTNEQAVGGVTSGLLELGDEVTWQATHLWKRRTLTSRITVFDRPHMFRDSMVTGAFRRFDHDHVFTQRGDVVLLEDRFDFDLPFGLLGRLANGLFVARHMSAFLAARLHHIRSIAECGEASRYLDSPAPVQTGGPRCPFCGDETMERSIPSVYAIWDSACGAVGSGSPMRPDLDEVADGLLAVFGLGGSVTESGVPVGDLGAMELQHYDIQRSLRQLRSMLHGHGFEMQTSTRGMPGHSLHSIWVRRAQP